MSQPQPMTIPQALQLAWDHHRAGRLQQAEALYRQVLASHPDNPDALHLLGMLALQVNRPDAALDLIDRAIAATPNVPQFHCNRGEALNRLKRHDEAILACEKALSLRPNFPEAMNNLGIAKQNKGQIQDAIALYRKALAVRPDFVTPHYNLCSALQTAGRLDDAIEALSRAVALRPDYVEAINNLGSLLHMAGRSEESVATFQKAIALRPDMPEAHFNLANVLRDLKRHDAAIAAYNRAIALRPHFPEAYLNLGLALQDLSRHAESCAMYRKAVLLRPDFGEARNNFGDSLRILGQYERSIVELNAARALLPRSVQVHSNLGNAYQDNSQLTEAIESYRRAIEIDPSNPSAQYNLGLALLLQGDLERGWPQYEWRRKVKRLAAAQFDFPQAIWDGSDLSGKRILLHAEQGLGDTLHFVRYVPLVIARGGKIILATQNELAPLFRRLQGIEQLITPADPLPAFDVHCPLPSLPGIFRTTLETIPRQIPYLSADPADVETWRGKLAHDPPDRRIKVGIAWAGRPQHSNDHNRTISLELLRPLLEHQAIARFISLQKGPATAQLRDLPAGIEVLEVSPDLPDFAQTAALIENLDLVITVDTSVAHLAGAMGKEVWVLIPVNPDWRWMLGREDSPWYPTMRLFRQARFGQWQPPIERIVNAIQDQALRASDGLC
jgi:tetratricopeptide (TPR) repeat protein